MAVVEIDTIIEASLPSSQNEGTEAVDLQDQQYFDRAYAGETSDTNGLGDSVVDELFDLKGSYNESLEQLNNRLGEGVESPADLMKIQFDLAKITMQQELLAKAAGKTTQNVETLIKAQ